MLHVGLLLLIGRKGVQSPGQGTVSYNWTLWGGERGGGSGAVGCDCYCWWSAAVVVHTGFMDLARYCGGLENELYAELRVGDVCSGQLGRTESQTSAKLTYE